MTSPSLVKKEIQARYDSIGETLLRTLDSVQDPTELWRAVEGDRPALAYFRRRKLETSLTLGGFMAGSRLLEVGCGTGDYTLLLARMGFKMIGVDLSPRSIEGAREKAAILGLSDVSFVVADAEALTEIPEGGVDGAVSFSTLRYVPNLESALRAIWRVVKPGGAAVVDFPNKFCPWFTLLKNYFGVETHIHDHQFSTDQIIQLMCRVGFHDVVATRILFTTYVLPSSLLPAFKLIDRVAEGLPLINKAAGIIVVKGMRL
jgi:SAM-dependent methyltransferase